MAKNSSESHFCTLPEETLSKGYESQIDLPGEAPACVQSHREKQGRGSDGERIAENKKNA